LPSESEGVSYHHPRCRANREEPKQKHTQSVTNTTRKKFSRKSSSQRPGPPFFPDGNVTARRIHPDLPHREQRRQQNCPRPLPVGLWSRSSCQVKSFVYRSRRFFFSPSVLPPVVDEAARQHRVFIQRRRRRRRVYA